MIILEQTRKILCVDETEAEMLVNKYKEETEGDIVDYKITNKDETSKCGSYTILTIKERLSTMDNAKELAGI